MWGSSLPPGPPRAPVPESLWGRRSPPLHLLMMRVRRVAVTNGANRPVYKKPNDPATLTRMRTAGVVR
jgi:hypothetical protein